MKIFSGNLWERKFDNRCDAELFWNDAKLLSNYYSTNNKGYYTILTLRAGFDNRKTFDDVLATKDNFISLASKHGLYAM